MSGTLLELLGGHFSTFLSMYICIWKIKLILPDDDPLLNLTIATMAGSFLIGISYSG